MSSQLACPLDGQSVDLEIIQFVFSFELLSTAHARSAKVDACNLRLGPTQGMLCRLGRTAAGNQNGKLFPKRSGRPEQMIIRAAAQPILPEASILIEALHRRGIWIPFVEVLDFRCHIKVWRLLFSLLAHRKSIDSAISLGRLNVNALPLFRSGDRIPGGPIVRLRGIRETRAFRHGARYLRRSCRWRAPPSPGRG